MLPELYIHSFCAISPAGMLNASSHSSAAQTAQGPKAACKEPDYKELIPPMQLRRMSKPVRTGVAAAKLCMKTYSDFMPASIHVGTAYGMLDDSENFLRRMMDQDEQMLNPTAFIQSTHNTVSGQIALSVGCTAHNMTYVHRAHSFENALLDAALMLPELDEDALMLTGAVEECTNTSFAVLERFGVYNEHQAAGEGAVFFCMSGSHREDSVACLQHVEMFNAADDDTANVLLDALLNRYNAEEHDLFLQSGDATHAAFKDTEDYSRYCGKYATMSAWGLAYACLRLRESGLKRCWLLTRFGNQYSLTVLHNPGT